MMPTNDTLALVSVMLGPIVLGFLIWLLLVVCRKFLRGVVMVRNAWRRFRKRPLVGERIEPVL